MCLINPFLEASANISLALGPHVRNLPHLQTDLNALCQQIIVADERFHHAATANEPTSLELGACARYSVISNNNPIHYRNIEGGRGCLVAGHSGHHVAGHSGQWC